MRDNLEGIDVFVGAVESGSFTKAAEALALSRSAVGKAVARLEVRLGVRLFHRTTRSQSLTEEGQIYYERCLRALAELRHGAAMLESGRREVVGKLKISMPTLFGRHCVQPILLDLAARHPGLELDLRFSDHVVDVINEGYDLVVRNHMPGPGSALRSTEVAGQRKAICAAPEYLSQNGRPGALDTLVEHEALVYWNRAEAYPWTFRDADGQMVRPALKWRIQFDSYEAMADATLRGMGIACLPLWLVHDQIREGQLVSLFQHIASERFDTFLVWPDEQPCPMKLRVTIDALTEGLKWIDDL